MKKAILSLSLLILLSTAAPALAIDKATELRGAVYWNDKPKVEELLNKGYDVNGRTADGFTPLITAAEDGNAEMVKLLLKHGADPTLKTDRGWTAYDCAKLGSYREIMDILAQAGGGPAPEKPKKTTPKPTANTPAKKKAASKTTSGTVSTSDHCKKMYGKSYMLCDSDDYSCKIKATNDYQKCQKTGTWY